LDAMSKPRRRPLEGRRRAPRPVGFYARGKTGLKGVLMNALGALNRRLYGLPPGAWLRRRLDRARVFHRLDLPLRRGGAGLDGLRIAYLSDLHAGPFMSEADLCRIFERVADAGPDLVCLGGDLVDARPEESLLLRKALSLLQPPLGLFAVPGNHDYYADPELRLWRYCLEEHGATVLVNQGRRIERGGETMWLAGVDDLGQGDPDLDAALEGALEEEPIVLLAHNPDFFFEAASAGVDLTLSGHTHAGQITFHGRTFLKQTTLGYWRGRFELDGAQLYVGCGAGTTGLPLRIHAPAEVPLIRIATRD
jgi:predicted MPP superfamily phosphohydrolase